MRGSKAIVAGGLAILSTPAAGQYYGGIPTGRTILDACYDPAFQHYPSRLPAIIPYAEKTMANYLGLARRSSELDKMFTGKRERRQMVIDGVPVDPRTAKDPWATRIAKLEPVGYVQSNEDFHMVAQWRALAADGTTLGTYDALLRTGAHQYYFLELRLFSAGSAVQPGELKPFCMTPGDIEKWQAKKVARDAKKAAREN